MHFFDGRPISQDDLKQILEKHKLFTQGAAGGERANLSSANLRGADLRGANLISANLSSANLRGANLISAQELHFSVCPEVGSFQCWKRVLDEEGDGVILLLEIPADARRVSTPIGRKCRAERVMVLRAETPDGEALEVTRFRSGHDARFVYTVGEIASVTDFDDDIRVECTRGLHFFITRQEAVEYR
jgi:hypothetical protein